VAMGNFHRLDDYIGMAGVDGDIVAWVALARPSN
jgi:hypothetical protein